jgi:hypothetical protein
MVCAIDIEGRVVLTEVIEPGLLLQSDVPGAVTRFADVILAVTDLPKRSTTMASTFVPCP